MKPDFTINQDLLGPKSEDGQNAATEQIDETAYRILLLQESIEDKRQDRDQRKQFGVKVFRLTIWWLFVLATVIMLQGFGVRLPLAENSAFKLSDKVLLALIAGASVNIIGLMAIVIRYLFPSKK